jgi:proteic killer suppression protein
MIASFRHKGLKLVYETGSPRKLPSQLVNKIERVLARLDVAAGPSDMDLPGFRLHPLTGDLHGFRSVRVSANWRIIFRLEDGDAHDVDLIDYH